MTAAEIAWAQIADPFRWGLVVALVLTMLRTEAVTGRWLPLAAGAVFVAVVVPATSGEAAWRPMAVGVAVNALMVGVVLAVRHVVLRIRP